MHCFKSFYTFYGLVVSSLPLGFSAPLTSQANTQVDRSFRRQSSCSGSYNFGINLVNVIEQRSAEHDTVYISACLYVASDYYCFTGYYGKHGRGSFNPDILFQNIPIGDDEVATFAYVIINNDHGTIMDIKTQLGNGTLALAQQGTQYAINNSDQSVAASIAQLFGATFGRIISFLINFVTGILNLFTQGCDGWLAAGVHGFTGAEICAGDVTNLQGTDVSDGTEDEKLFGFIPGIVCNTQTSVYDVSWFVQISDGIGNMTMPGAYFSKASRLGPGAILLLWSAGVGIFMYIVG